MTDEEQDVAVDIKNTVVDSAQITQSIAQTIFGEIYPNKNTAIMSIITTFHLTNM